MQRMDGSSLKSVKLVFHMPRLNIAYLKRIILDSATVFTEKAQMCILFSYKGIYIRILFLVMFQAFPLESPFFWDIR